MPYPYNDDDDANPPELPANLGWHVMVSRKCVYCGQEFDTQMVADAAGECEGNDE